MKEISVTASRIPEDAKLRVPNAPKGIDYRVVSRQPDQIVLKLVAAESTEQGAAKISVEARIGGRWAATAPIELVISARKKPQTASR